MNLKSKAISEIRSTILTLSAHPHNEPHSEFADRINGLQVLLGELEGEQGGKGVPTEQEIKNASKAHYMQYDGEYDSIAVADKAFNEAVQWAISQMQPEWVSVKDGYPETGTKCYFYRKGTSDFVYTGNYNGIDQWGESYFKEDNEDAYYRDVTHYLPFLKPQSPTK